MPQLIGVHKVDGCKISHTGSYYEISMARIGLHCLHWRRHHGGRPVFSSCIATEDLWEKCLLKPDAGARKGADFFCLRDFKAACKYVERMRALKSSYCLCDMACFLCLAYGMADSRSTSSKRRRVKEWFKGACPRLRLLHAFATGWWQDTFFYYSDFFLAMIGDLEQLPLRWSFQGGGFCS